MLKSFAISCLALSIMALAGCGFKPRAETPLPAAMQKTYLLSAKRSSDLSKFLARRLRSQGIELVTVPSADAATLKISKQSFRREVLSLNLRGRASEYQLILDVSFSLADGAGKTLVTKQTLKSRRDYTFDEQNVLGKTGEEALLRESMVKDMVQRILRRLATAKSN